MFALRATVNPQTKYFPDARRGRTKMLGVFHNVCLSRRGLQKNVKFLSRALALHAVVPKSVGSFSNVFALRATVPKMLSLYLTSRGRPHIVLSYIPEMISRTCHFGNKVSPTMF